MFTIVINNGNHNFDKRGKCKRCKKIVKIIINNNRDKVECCDEILGKLDQIIDGNGGNGTDCDVCPLPEGIMKSWVAKTGQTPTVPIIAPTGSDGNLEKGITWPTNPRFTINGDGTVTDNLTCLIWDQDANRFGTQKWAQALTSCNTLDAADDDANGDTLDDDSEEGDWRLPNVGELQSLIHYGVTGPAVPNTAGTGQWTDNPTPDPFSAVQSSFYWSSTTVAGNTTNAWIVNSSTIRPPSDTYGVYEAGRDA